MEREVLAVVDASDTLFIVEFNASLAEVDSLSKALSSAFSSSVNVSPAAFLADNIRNLAILNIGVSNVSSICTLLRLSLALMLRESVPDSDKDSLELSLSSEFSEPDIESDDSDPDTSEFSDTES